MKFALTLLTAISFCLASIVVRSLGELIVLRHPPTNDGTERNLTCLSEDNDAALIWNYNFKTDSKNGFTELKKPSDVSHCAIWNSMQCLTNWEDINEWDTVNSADRPMGPVLDYRWEGFKEFVFNEDEKDQGYQYVRKIQKSAETIVFSVRGSRGVNILLCKNEQPNNAPCVSIILGSFRGQQCEIRNCPFGNGGKCTVVDNLSRVNEKILDEYEWRTFILKCSENESIIQVSKVTDREDPPFFKGRLKNELNGVFNIFIKSDVSARVRFHFYDYYQTVSKSLTVSSEQFDYNGKGFCIELLVGLCPKCELSVKLRYTDGYLTKTYDIGTIRGTKTSFSNGVLRWRSVKLKTQRNISSKVVRLMIQNSVNHEFTGQWAIGNVRMCESVESDQLISSWLKSCGSSCESSRKNLSICDPNGCTCDRGLNDAGYCNPDFQLPPEKFSDLTNIEIKLISTTGVTLQWQPARSLNGKTVHYDILIKRAELIGCSDLGRPSPEQNEILRTTTEAATVSFADLHPYADYTATVSAYTTISGKPRTVMFQTLATEIPTSNVSNLRLRKDNRRIEWDEPADCTTITGPYKLKMLVFTGVSESVKDFHVTKYTSYTHYDTSKLGKLAHYEQYRVRIYVIRNNNGTHNSTCYQVLDWRTPPAKPTAVKNSTIYEVDPDRRTFSLRWLEPQPPNGEIESYNLSIEGMRYRYIKIPKYSKSEQNCDQYKNYLCLRNLTLPPNLETHNPKIEIYALNKDVSEPGDVETVTFVRSEIFTVPSRPQNLRAIPEAHGIVNLEWTHPSISYTKIVRFQIRVEVLSTKLSENLTTRFPTIEDHSISKEQKNYTRKLYLVTSTYYKIYVTAVNEKNFISSEAQVRISVDEGVAFVGDLEVSQDGTLINLKVPGLVNATDETIISVVVNGTLKCEQNSVSSLVAFKYQPKNAGPRQLTIDANDVHGNGSNCSLDIGKSYHFTVNATDSNSVVLPNLMTAQTIQTKNKSHSFNWLTVLPIIIAICVIFIFIWHRKRILVAMKLRQPSYVEPISVSLRLTGTNSNSTHLNTRELTPSVPRRPSYLEIIPPSPTTTPINDWPALDTTTSSLQPKATEDRSSDHVYTLPNAPDFCCVRIEGFAEYAKNAAASRRLHSQFTILQRILPSSPCDYGKLPENMPKNRNEELGTYDHSRVVLQKILGDPHSDYINANYIKGYEKEKAYIAAQGPKPNTVNDFWRMVWQEKVGLICMLTNVIEGGETKCEKYWPDVGTGVKYGDFHVSNTNDQVYADYTFRTLELSYQRDTRQVIHLHYTGWPDLGVPIYPQSLVDYLRKLERTPNGTGPVVVHCSTGDDRTGTIILCAICLRQAVVEKVIDIMAVAARMRDSRANMVGTLQQYVLAHIIITESLTSWPTHIPCADVLSNRINKLRIQLPFDMKRLSDTTWQLQALQSSAAVSPPTAKHLINAEISEFAQDRPEVIYDDVCAGERNQINAVSVDGVKAKKQYLACWLPSPLTLPNFWEFIVERDIKLIIILQCSDPRNPTCCDIIPDESITIPLLKIEVENQTGRDEGKYFTIEKLRLTETSEANTRLQSLTVLTCKGWGCGTIQNPPTPKALLSLWQASEKIPRKEGQTLVLCHDGVTGCGLYLAMSFLLERMAVERECDVISAVRAVRRSNPKFVQLTEQCEYLYDSAQAYAEYFQYYANFS